MATTPILPDGESVSQSSVPTAGGGDGRARSPSAPQGDPFDPRSEASLPTMRPGSRPDAIGRIDHYDLVRKLGGGGFGVVYLALDTVSGVEVALKTLHPLLKHNAEEMDLLREKFRLVCRLSHPNIASPLVLHPCQRIEIWNEEVRREMRLSPGDSVMVMRYAPGVTLSKWRRQFPDGRVPLPLALEVARQVATALDYAHSEKIVHRDVKPGNIMVETLGPSTGLQDAQDSPGSVTAGRGHPVNPENPVHPVSKLRVRILDFGLAAEIRSSMSRVSTETGDTSGTRPYMAPEQWLGRKQDGRTDQYALACVLYELLSGAPPFAGVFETGDPAIMMQAVTTGSPEAVEDVPDAVNEAFSRALAKDRTARFPTCAAFVGSCLAQSSQSPQGNYNAEPQSCGEGRVRSPGAPTSANPKGVRSPDRQQGPATDAVSEADVLRRKLTLSRAVKTIPAEDRADAEFAKIVGKAEDELAVAEEACKFGRFATAAESLKGAQKAFDELTAAKAARKAREEAARKAREEAERKAREEAERKAREEAARKAREEWTRKAREEAALKAYEESERKAREEAARKAREEAERKAREEAARRAREEAARKAREEAQRKAREEAERKLFEEAERKRRSETRLRFFFGLAVWIVVAAVGYFAIRQSSDTGKDSIVQINSGEDANRAEAEREAARRDVAIDLGGGVKLEMIPCPGVAPDFWMGKYEVTQEQWRRVMGTSPAYFSGKPKNPVETVSWNDCQEFVKKLNALSGAKASGLTFRLPTEEEWETACRAGAPKSADYCIRDDGVQVTASTLSSVARYVKAWDGGPVAVGSFRPNAWGLYDMHGNVWEWTQTADGDFRVSRGGGFYYTAGLHGGRPEQGRARLPVQEPRLPPRSLRQGCKVARKQA